MSSLKVSVSGVRGIVGDSLTPEIILNYSLAFAEFIKQHGSSVAVARDTRESGDMIFNIVTGALKSCGINVFDYGILPTPVLIYAVKKNNYAGGVIITASHNPIEWNALKFVKAPGLFLNQEDLDSLIENIKTKDITYCNYKNCGSLIKKNINDNFIHEYVADLISFFDIEKIGKSGIKAAYDPVNATASYVTPILLKKIGVEFTAIHDEPEKGFERGTEPTPENLTKLCKTVKKQKLDIGFAHDPDADRLALVDNSGAAIGEEYTLALSAFHAYKNRGLNTDMAANLSTSMMSRKIAETSGQNIIEAKVGEINVTQEMIKNKCKLGGEGNGGVIFPEFNSCRDSFVAIMFILELIATEKTSVKQIAENNIPVYEIFKSKISIQGLDVNNIYEKLKEKFSGCSFNELDGLKIFTQDYWIHVRPSNTEPVFRIIIESGTKKQNETLFKSVKDTIIGK